MKYKTALEPKCTVGWPKTSTGYPRCETMKGAETTQVAPNIYEYCCPPLPLEMKDISGIKRRSNYRSNVPRPKGVHSYYNVMWDGHVRRGDPAQKQEKKEEEECEKIRQRLNQPRKGKTLAQTRAEKRSADAETIVQREIVRYSQLAIANLAPKDPEKYLVDLSDEIDVLDPCYKGRQLQTLRTFPIAPSRKPNLEDVGTQVLPNEFFDFEGQAQNTIERLVGSVVEQARLELSEEEELEALQSQQRRHENLIESTKMEIQRWVEREEKLEAEKQRLKEEQQRLENMIDETTRLYNVCAFSGGLTKDAISECIESLRKEGFIASKYKAIVEQVFIPWLNRGVEREVKVETYSRDFLDELIIDVVNQRESQYAEEIWGEVYENYPLSKYGDPPRTPETSLWEFDSEEEFVTTEYLTSTTGDA